MLNWKTKFQQNRLCKSLNFNGGLLPWYQKTVLIINSYTPLISSPIADIFACEQSVIQSRGLQFGFHSFRTFSARDMSSFVSCSKMNVAPTYNIARQHANHRMKFHTFCSRWCFCKCPAAHHSFLFTRAKV